MLSDAFGDIENDCDLYICTTETNAMMAFFLLSIMAAILPRFLWQFIMTM